MIKEYIKDNKKYYEVKNHYIGINVFTGKEKRINKKGFTSKRKAELYINNAISYFENNITCSPSNDNIKIKDLIEMWQEEHKNNVKGSSMHFIKYPIKIINDKLGNIKLKNLNFYICQKLINECSKKYSKSYTEKVNIYLKNIIDYAVKTNMITQNVATHVKIPRTETEKRINYYSKNELIEFLEIIKNNYDIETLLIFRLLAYTGARKGEIMALNWNDIDFKNCTVSITKTISKDINGKTCINTTKTSKSNRDISIDKDTLKLLKEFRIQKKYVNINNIFSKVYGHYFNELLKKIYKDYPKLKKITIHGFRHTHASLLFEAGANIKDVQERLGHTDIKTTMNVYTHLSKKQKEKTADIFYNFMAL
ncbi:tyrosine-type recombinase/integrase [Gemelliphila palaticanis]|uniref:Site-specific integrase n=1 Tax=Gemelliphila palaticanis TaxID=81950 RepID=A0ABX2SXD1_9BACL|nr:site-specific integrase [Gemella palaticanis]MBF0714667.1 site-specific integrase [Gemella palaticanis]NYS46597.1 site-specific integrase [Gemella palaticanis]